jgi:leucyl aminopeptidase (aminopeptidase T)
MSASGRELGGLDMIELDLMESAYRLVTRVIGVTQAEKVLIVTDADKLNIGRAFASVCRGLGNETVVAIMPMTGEHGNEPPATIAAAMKAADVVFAPTTHAITHTRARMNAYAAGTRVIILRGVDEDMMIKGAMTADFEQLKETTARVANALSEVDNVRVTSPAGTDVSFALSGRKVFTLDGYFQEDMGFAALPGGEAPTSPVEGTTNGIIAVDYSMDSLGRLNQPLKFKVEDGRVVSVSGSSEYVSAIEQIFEKDGNARNIAEFAIGTNPKARLIGNLAEDKKLLGTVHFAIGDNKSLGGSVEASIHLDGLILKPTVTADNKRTLVEDGRLMGWLTS